MGSCKFICAIFCYLLIGALFAVGFILGITENASKMYDTFHFITSANSAYDLYTAIVSGILLGIWAAFGIFCIIVVFILGVCKCCKPNGDNNV